MEFRYVYRRIEDAIGHPYKVADSPHARVGAGIRYAFREGLDIARNTAITALCLSSIGGNSAIDVAAMSQHVADLIDSSLGQRVPYFKSGDEQPSASAESSMYDEYFKQLNEMVKEANEKKAGADGQAKPEDEELKVRIQET